MAACVQRCSFGEAPMSVSPEVRAAQVAANEREYGEVCGRLRWLDAVGAERAERERREILASCGGGLSWSCGGTKPHYGPLSPGCVHCMGGTWSCLFVNGVCNARCFFCPAPQDDCGDPITGQIPFRRAGDYADFLERFGFGGASLSGGEPLLTLGRTLEYLRAVRQRFGAGLYLWLYTNGLLASDETLAALAAVGLDEIRFNLHGGGYRLDGVERAVRHIPCVTIETPAVPEEEERMGRLLPRLAELGVRHVNLHDIRVTPHNAEHVVRRGYTCLHGPKVTVLDAELAALRLLRQAVAERLPLAVQYCCFAYKNPYQGRGYRRRWCPQVMRPAETLTPTGDIRTCAVQGEREVVAALVAGWEAAGLPRISWAVQGRGERVHVVPELLRGLDSAGLEVSVSYASAATVAAPSYRFLPMKVKLNRKVEITVERRPCLGKRILPPEQLADFLLLAGDETVPVPAQLADLAACERLPEGLPSYY